MIDERTQLDSVSINQKTKIYNLNMSLVNLAISEIDISFIYKTFEESIMPASCKSEVLKVFFNEGYKINYIYTDKTGQLISKHTVNPAYCK
ncbi:hypothetical protein MNBD_GAMMA10-488 [hydrothermal vent metagenome]|uniref:Uncharacterized protein n=1 Tax=hydrothermal vent metagenome TaxID=652676 RepID=A0A3B0XXL3_9ZZZZ